MIIKMFSLIIQKTAKAIIKIRAQNTKVFASLFVKSVAKTFMFNFSVF